MAVSKLRHTPASVVAAVFLAICNNDGRFPAELSRSVPSLSGLMVLRIGGLINYMNDKALVSRASCSGIGGEYPNNHLMANAGATNFSSITDEVKNALQALSIQNALKQAAESLVGIQESMVMAGVGKVLGKPWDWYDKAMTAQSAANQINEWVGNQYSVTNVQILIGSM
jgi:hypothetical protein